MERAYWVLAGAVCGWVVGGILEPAMGESRVTRTAGLAACILVGAAIAYAIRARSNRKRP